jgi:hypothetical protein
LRQEVFNLNTALLFLYDNLIYSVTVMRISMILNVRIFFITQCLLMPDCERSVTRTLFMDENSDRNH